MGELGLAALTASWLGILTSISPCPLATNIAAISYIGRQVGRPRSVLLAGILYTLGRVAAYVALGAAAVWSLSSMVSVSTFLQGIFQKLVGPILILVGMVLLGLISWSFQTAVPAAEGMQRRADRWGVWGAAPLGVVFALSFCPVSAALFFGSLVPLAIDRESALLLPTLYGVGTGIPVVFFAGVVALGVGWLGQAYERLGAFEVWARRVTGVIIVLVGIYETLRSVFGVL